MDKPSADTWVSVTKISSSRSLLPGETVAAFAIAEDTGDELERVVLTPSGTELNRFSWPCVFSELVNNQATRMRAGAKGADGTFKGQLSESLNLLWRQDKNVRVFTTACDLDNWSEAETLRTAEDLTRVLESNVLIKVQSTDEKCLYETLTFCPSADRYQQFRWEADLCRFINLNSVFIRAGEKNTKTQLFENFGSQYRNKFWVPVDSGLKVTYEIVEVSRPVDSLRVGDDDVLPDMTGFEPDSLGNDDARWFSPGYLLADRDLVAGEKLHAWLIRSSDGKPLESVEFIADASNRLKAKWPEAFAKAISAGAKQLTAGGWGDDGQFSALGGSATGSEFASMDLPGKAKINRLWHYNENNRAFTTAAFANNWVKALSLDTKTLNPADTLWIQVRDLRTQYLYETHIFKPRAAGVTPAVLIKELSEQINRDGKMLRAGALASATTRIAAATDNNSLWVAQCSDLAVTLMPVNWWTQSTVKASRDLQDKESIYCYVWDDFSNVELVAPLCFIPKTAAERKSNAWPTALATAIKASSLAPYVRLGSAAAGSDDPGADATQATVWQVGAPLRVFTTEPTADNWMSATGSLVDLYKDNKTAVLIELFNGLTRGRLQTITYKPSATAVTDKDGWLQALYKYLTAELAEVPYIRIGDKAGITSADSAEARANMKLWVPRRSGIVVEVQRLTDNAGAEVALSRSEPRIISPEDLVYLSTAQIAERLLVVTVMMIWILNNTPPDPRLLYLKIFNIPLDLVSDANELLETRKNRIIELFASILPDRRLGADLMACVFGCDDQNLGEWLPMISELSADESVKKFILKYQGGLCEIYDYFFYGAGNRSYDKGVPAFKFDQLLRRNQLFVYAVGSKSYIFRPSLVDGKKAALWVEFVRQETKSDVRMLSVSDLGSFGRLPVYSVQEGIVIDFYVPDRVVLDKSSIIMRIGQVTADKIWSFCRLPKMTFVKEQLPTPDSPLCADYGNTYRSEVFDVSGQNETGVDPRTGLFNAHYSLAVLMGMEGKGPQCDLTLHYSALRANEAGLGDGWAFNLSSYESRSRLITLSNGQTIELTAEDITTLREKKTVSKKGCRISATFRSGVDTKVNDGIEALTLVLSSGAQEVLSAPTGDTVDLQAKTVETIISKLKEAKAAIDKTKEQDAPKRNTTAGIVGEVFAWLIIPVGIGITTNNSVRYNKARTEWEKKWAEKLPELVKPIDDEIAYWQRESGHFLPSTITSAAGGSLSLEWERRKGQYLLKKVSSNGKTLLTGQYPDVDADKRNEVLFGIWPGTDEAYEVKLKLQDYLLKSVVRKGKSAEVLQTVHYGYGGDPTLDRVLISIEESDGSLEIVFYETEVMHFPGGVMEKPPLPRVIRHIVQPGAGQASLVTRWTYSNTNYLGGNSKQSFLRGYDAAVKEGEAYTYGSTASEAGGIAITRTWNGLHLQVKEQEVAPDGVGKTTEWVFASTDPASALFGLVTSIKTTYQEPEKESAK